MPIIKPKEITLKTEVGDEKNEKTFNIGRYPASSAVEMITRGAALLRDAVKGNASNSESYAKSFQKLGMDMCKYVEVRMPNGEFTELSNDLLINAHITDADMFLLLMREVHDYNTNFMNTGRIFKTSRSLMEQAKAQITGILSRFSDSSSAKSKPRSKTCARSTTTKTR
jgi:hypothetical protein